jgi:hypothetical protein
VVRPRRASRPAMCRWAGCWSGNGWRAR